MSPVGLHTVCLASAYQRGHSRLHLKLGLLQSSRKCSWRGRKAWLASVQCYSQGVCYSAAARVTPARRCWNQRGRFGVGGASLAVKEGSLKAKARPIQILPGHTESPCRRSSGRSILGVAFWESDSYLSSSCLPLALVPLPIPLLKAGPENKHPFVLVSGWVEGGADEVAQREMAQETRDQGVPGNSPHPWPCPLHPEQARRNADRFWLEVGAALQAHPCNTPS